MVTFRCKRSGNTVSFESPDDIEIMRKHEEYVEVVDETDEKIQKEAHEKREVLKLRPKKAG